MSSVAVVIPCYELGRFLPEAIASVQAQTLKPEHVLVVDDGSRDPVTLEALERLETDGVTVLRSEHRGASAARNLGIGATESELVLCLDADDVLMPRFLEQTVEALQTNPAAGIASGHVEFFGDRTGVWHVRPFDPTRLLWENCIGSASLFRRRCWKQAGGYRDIEGCQDWDLWLSIVEHGWRWQVVDETLYRYRVRRGSLSERRDARRGPLLRQLVELHRDAYERGLADLVADVDDEVRRLRKRLEALETAHDLAEDERKAEVRAVVAAVEQHTPPGARIAVVSRGDPDVLLFRGRTAEHFPATVDGDYAGHHPASSEEGLALLDAARARGAEFLAVPNSASWWLEYYSDFGAGLEVRARQVQRTDACVIFDVGTYHSFSVVVCTRNRAEALRRSLASILSQEYPSDLLEIVVVDNGSTDGTRRVAEDVLAPSELEALVVHEPSIGLSAARNAGVRAARNEYVAFLDDDAVAWPGWLRAINSVIHRRHALVVGGRVVKDYERPAAWLDHRYVDGLFGVDYRRWGKTHTEFRVRSPYYVAGGNCAYARRLFDHFGSFDTRLGRKGTGLLAAEETLFNLSLEQAGVPIYYTDAAVVTHRVECRRLTRRHVLRRSFMAGLSAAKVSSLNAAGPKSPWSLHGVIRAVPPICTSAVRSCYRARAFGDLCASVASLASKWPVAADEGMTHDVLGWDNDDWLEEIERWPESREKRLHLELARRWPAGAADAAGSGDSPPALDELWGPLREHGYARLVDCVRSTVARVIPAGEEVAVVSRGDDALVTLPHHRGHHFPSMLDGTYAGQYPADGPEAVAQLETARSRGARFLVVPEPARWWLDVYGLHEYLEVEGEVLADIEGTCLIAALPPGESLRVDRAAVK